MKPTDPERLLASYRSLVPVLIQALAQQAPKGKRVTWMADQMPDVLQGEANQAAVDDIRSGVGPQSRLMRLVFAQVAEDDITRYP